MVSTAVLTLVNSVFYYIHYEDGTLWHSSHVVMFTLGRAGGRPVFRVLTPTLYRARMAGTRQTLSMDCSHPAPAPAPLLPRPQAQDSLDLELGASASRVADRQPAHCAPVPEAGGLGGYMVQA